MRMVQVYDPKAPKKPANLSLNSDLLRRARALGINLSAVLEAELEEVVRRRLSDQWRAENREAIAAYNAHVDSHGVFSDGLRGF
jgi:antitoxin CcdA